MTKQSAAKINASDILSFCVWMVPVMAATGTFGWLAWEVIKAFG